MRSKQRADLTTISKNTRATVPATAPLSAHTAQPPPPASLPDTRSPRSGMHAFITLLRSPAGFLCSSVTKRTRSSSPPSSPTSSSNVTLPAVVLQTYSTSTEGIVLTALPSAPFCCHEDLLTMSREKLEDVVRALNEKLPRRMRIGVAVERKDQWVGSNDDEDLKGAIAGMSDAEIRRKIEVLVGIRKREGLGDLNVPFESVPADAPTLELPATCTHSEVPVSLESVDTSDHERWPTEDKDLACEVEVDGSHAKVELSSSDIVHTTTSSPPRGRGHTLPPLTAFQKSTRPRSWMTLESRANGERRLKI
ncbi:hypothetical protein EV401DRAFT_2242089 [Pisolithus croceorrhizus]|nr:hypothetical protein EV401DRAFT_2242089 [Pisolithus croceorrhizus]